MMMGKAGCWMISWGIESGNEAILKNSLTQSPLRRIGDPDEMAGAVVYFASAASSFTTGQTLVLDGGGLA